MQSKTSSEGGSNVFKSLFAVTAMVVAFIIAFIVYIYVFGAKSNFNIDDKGHMEPIAEGMGHWYATIYKGGFIVPVILGLLIIVVTFSLERLLTIARATGTGNMDNFLKNVKIALNDGNLDTAIVLCDKQKRINW